MNLRELFEKHDGRLIDKWHQYLPVYERYLGRWRGQSFSMMEFGVSQGGSLQLWREYFGPDARLWGVDINPNCQQFEDIDSNVLVRIGDQEDRQFLRSLASEVRELDVVIDDGGHTMQQQINTFQEIFPILRNGGIYIIEDLHTSYWKRWGGGYRKSGTFIEFSKSLIDQLNAWHSREPSKFSVDNWTKSIRSLHYYDSMLVVEKEVVEAPTRERKGKACFEDYEHKSPLVLDRIKAKLRGK